MQSQRVKQLRLTQRSEMKVKGNQVNMSTSGQPAKWASPNTAVAAWTAPSTEKTSFNLLLHYIQILIYLDWIFLISYLFSSHWMFFLSFLSYFVFGYVARSVLLLWNNVQTFGINKVHSHTDIFWHKKYRQPKKKTIPHFTNHIVAKIL